MTWSEPIQPSPAAELARGYYDSDDADRFYATIWGGEDIHIGLYARPDEDIFTASQRTVARLASRLELGPGVRVLDLGSGFGGPARLLARRFGCEVVGLNISAVENDRARRLTAAAGLSGRVEIVDGSFEAIPFPAHSFDVVWSQDAILHSGDRPRVFAEIARVLRPGGELVFTDPMQSDAELDALRAARLRPILARIHLESLGSPQRYAALGGAVGLELLSFEELTDQLTTHYRRVLEQTRAEHARLGGVSPEYIERMCEGLGHWIEGGARGDLCWGLFHMRKAGEVAAST